jgi:FG-GAP repeat
LLNKYNNQWFRKPSCPRFNRGRIGFFAVFVILLILPTLPVSALTLTEAAKLLAGDGAAVDLFSYSVSVSGDTAVIGAYLDDDSGTDSGSAHIFDSSGEDTDSDGILAKSRLVCVVRCDQFQGICPTGTDDFARTTINRLGRGEIELRQIGVNEGGHSRPQLVFL